MRNKASIRTTTAAAWQQVRRFGELNAGLWLDALSHQSATHVSVPLEHVSRANVQAAAPGHTKHGARKQCSLQNAQGQNTGGGTGA